MLASAENWAVHLLLQTLGAAWTRKLKLERKKKKKEQTHGDKGKEKLEETSGRTKPLGVTKMTRNKPKKANKFTIFTFLSTVYPFWPNDNLYICNIFKYWGLLPTEHHKHQTIKFNNRKIEPLSKLSESESTVSGVVDFVGLRRTAEHTSFTGSHY